MIPCPAHLWCTSDQESGYMGSVVQAWSHLLATACNRNDCQYSKSHSVCINGSPSPPCIQSLKSSMCPRPHTSEELTVVKECFSCVYSQKREIRQKRSLWLGGRGPSVLVHALLGSQMKTSMLSAWGFATALEAPGAEGQTQV